MSNTCFSPLQAWRGGVNKATGKRSIVWKRPKGYANSEILLPCGQCVGCRLERSRQWAMRCVHESEMYEKNCFLTLTYDEVKVPEDGNLCLRDLQLFFKRLRKRFNGVKIRYFACGEYGENFGRPHYHVCVFNLDFDDKYLWTVKNGNRLYRSPELEKLWDVGFSLIGAVTFESAAYVARYIMKKVTGEEFNEHYVDKDSGFMRTPEFVTMSRGGRCRNGENLGGIGATWYRKFRSDVYPHGFTVVRGVKVSPPKYYDGLYEIDDPVNFALLKSRRMDRINHIVPLIDRLDGMSDFSLGFTPQRLRDKEFCKKEKMKMLIRPMEVLQ